MISKMVKKIIEYYIPIRINVIGYLKCPLHFILHLYIDDGAKDLDGTTAKRPKTPFNNEAYSAFKRGNVVKGILCPSLTNSFRAQSLERSYLTYSHRQRQKSLIIVNIVDLILKVVLAVVWAWRSSPGTVRINAYQIIGSVYYIQEFLKFAGSIG